MNNDVKVRVIVENHEHQGQRCKVGDELIVDPDRARWLMELGVAEPSETQAASNENSDDEEKTV